MEQPNSLTYNSSYSWEEISFKGVCRPTAHTIPLKIPSMLPQESHRFESVFWFGLWYIGTEVDLAVDGEIIS